MFLANYADGLRAHVEVDAALFTPFLCVEGPV